MISKFTIIRLSIVMFLASACSNNIGSDEVKIIFLHHSTGGVIAKGASADFRKDELLKLFGNYNKNNKTNYQITLTEFPKANPYGWNNYPFDYYNIWVKHGGDQPYLMEPTLEILSKEYNTIMFKHCFPVSNIQADLISPDINSDIKTISNFKLQYLALRDKLHQFPNNKFIVWTGAVQVRNNVSEEEALRAKEFFNWVINEWDLPDDNIFIWDFYSLETDGELYLKEEYASSSTDSHPNKRFAAKAVGLLFSRIIDIIESDGKSTNLTGAPSSS